MMFIENELFLNRMKKRMALQNTDPRRRLELKDANLIHEDQTAFANLPMKSFQKEVPWQMSNHKPYFDDEIGF